MQNNKGISAIEDKASLIVTSLATVCGLKADFTLHSSGITLLLGANGSGKSTLLRTILGLVRAKAGCVDFQDADGTSNRLVSSRDIARYISYVPQSFRVNLDLTVSDIVALGERKGLFSSYKDLSKVDEILKELGIEHLRARSILTLSGGELALVSLARALMQDTPFLFIDEGDAALDLGRRWEFYAVLDRLAKEEKKGILLVTHNPESALKCIKPANILLSMPDGILASVPPQSLSLDLLGRAYGTELTSEQVDLPQVQKI